jgi:hypothetical protein
MLVTLTLILAAAMTSWLMRNEEVENRRGER